MATTQLICIVDDAADYRFLTQEVFRRFLAAYPIRLFSSGEELLATLPQLSPQPSLILLDRHMPGLDGQQTLLALKQAPAWRKIPVVMMSADASPAEIDRCYEAGANSFLAKPLHFERLQQSLSLVCQYWLSLNLEPTHY